MQKNNSKSIKGIILVAVFLLAFCGVAAVLLLISANSQRQDNATTNGGQTAASASCGGDMISRYNKLRDESGEKYLNGLDQLASEVQESANAAQDATCQYILFIHAYYHDDSDAMQRFFNTLQQLAKDGHAVSDDVIGVESADQMQSYINDVKNGVPTIEGGGSGVG